MDQKVNIQIPESSLVFKNWYVVCFGLECQYQIIFQANESKIVGVNTNTLTCGITVTDVWICGSPS